MPEPGPRLFLSYARGDDEPFVKRLYERLTADGFDVWWDRERMPSRALTFLKEIREAVRASDRVVVVIGPKCVTSDYCRAEWQAGLAESKVVNPLMRIGERRLLPPELGQLHCPDFREDARFDDAFREMVRVLLEPIPPLGALLGGVPDVPPHFQPRPDDLTRLAVQVLIDEKKPVVLTGPQRATVLHGMGGTGKSVLAATFARSTSTRRSFGDGVFWLTAGDSVPLAITAELGRLLGDPAQHHLELTTSKSRLAEVLEERSALVVLDNAWRVEQIEPLIDAMGPSCRLLITSRLGELATATGAHAIELGILSPEAALQHLADWTGVGPDALPAAAKDVAKECGYLPFALALNGAMHQMGVAWPDLLDALRNAEIDYAEQRFKGYPYPTVLKSIQVSMDALDAADADAGARLRELAAFHANGGIPEGAVAVLWAHTANLAGRHVSKTLVQLAGKALIRLDGEPAARRVLIHDLQRDYLVRVADAAALNTSLLTAYEASCDGAWASVAPDGYVHAHLVDHLYAAGRADTVDALLDMSTPEGRNAWFEANAAIDNLTGWLRDVARAGAKGDEPGAVYRALMGNSVESMLSQIPAELHVALMRAGTSSAASALAGARRIEDPEPRVQAILALVPQLDEAERAQALAECLATVRGRANQVQARFLPRIAAHFTGEECNALAMEALEQAMTVGIAPYRAEALGALLDVLEPGPVRAQVTAEAQSALQESVTSPSFAEAAAAVLPHIPDIAASVLEQCRAVVEPFTRSMAFEKIVPHLPPSDRAAAAQEGIASFEASGANGLWIVISLARHITGYDLDALIRRAVTGDTRQVPALIDMLPDMLEGDALQAALDTIGEAAAAFDEPDRTHTRIRLLAHYAPDRRATEVDTLLQTVDALPYPTWRRNACADLIEHAGPAQLGVIRSIVARLDDAAPVLESAARLAVHGEAALRDEVLGRVSALPASREKFIALVALAQPETPSQQSGGAGAAAQPPDAQRAAIVDAAFALADDLPAWNHVTDAVLALAPLLDDHRRTHLLARAWQAVLRVPGFVSEDAFVRLAPALAGDAREQGFRYLLEEAERASAHQQQSYTAAGMQVTQNTAAVADTLARIAPHLPDTLIDDALATLRRMTDEAWRCLAVLHLLPRIAPADRAAVLQEAAALLEGQVAVNAEEVDRYRRAACAALARALPATGAADRDRLHQGLKNLLGSVGTAWIPGLIEDVLPVLSPAEAEALAERALAGRNLFTPLAASRCVPPPRRWSLLLDALAAIVPGDADEPVMADLLARTIAALLDAPEEIRRDAWQRALGLSTVAPPATSGAAGSPASSGADRAASRLRGERAGVALYLAALAPLGASVQREATLAAAARSLLTVQRWWP